MNLALGSLYAWSVFVLPLEREFSWTRAETSWVFTIATICFALSFIAAGRLQDAKGPRICGIIGGTLVSGGFVLSSFTTSLASLYLYFGVLVGIGNGFGYAAPTPMGSKWFPDKRGLVIGLLVGGYGAGSAILGPLATSLIADIGWRPTFRVLGALFFVMSIVGALLMKNPPAGYRPPNWTPPATSAVTRHDIPPQAMLSQPTFYLLWIAYCLGTTAGLMTVSQLVPFARSAGMGATAATLAITFGAVGNAGGRIVSGWMSDTLGRLTTLRVMVLLSAIATPMLFVLREQIVPFYVLVMLVYWCYGTQLSVFASTTADFFGTKYLGQNYGLLFTAWGAAGILGPIIGGRAFDRFGDYSYAFFGAAALALVALVALTFARPPTTSPTTTVLSPQSQRA